MSAEKFNKDLRLAVKNIDRFDGGMLDAALTGLDAGLILTIGRAQTHYLSGPRPRKLDVVTRRLRNSLTHRVTRKGRNRGQGRIGTNVPYGRFHELGFHGTQRVEAHGRLLPEGRTSRKTGLAQDRGTFVVAHDRKVDYAGRPFLLPALIDSQEDIAAEINGSVERLLEVRGDVS